MSHVTSTTSATSSTYVDQTHATAVQKRKKRQPKQPIEVLDSATATASSSSEPSPENAVLLHESSSSTHGELTTTPEISPKESVTTENYLIDSDPITHSEHATPSLPGLPQEPSRLVKVNILSCKEVGEFSITATTKFQDLRRQVALKLGADDFSFQHPQTRRSIATEDALINSKDSSIIVSQATLVSLLADTTIQDSDNSVIRENGTAVFKVSWWDEQFKRTRPVQLRFMEDGRIIVSAPGGSFCLFNKTNLRSNLVLTTVKGNEKGFQFIRVGTKKAARFFASSIEQKQLITVYYCFDWRARAVQEKWMPTDQEDIGDAVQPNDPRQIVSLLRSHIQTATGMADSIDKNLDSSLAREYMGQFFHVIAGGIKTVAGKEFEGHYTHSDLDTLVELKKAVLDPSKDPKASSSSSSSSASSSDIVYSSDVNKSSLKTSASAILKSSIESSEHPFLDEPVVASSSASFLAAPDGSGPPPPPKLPPPAAKLLPSICPVNFDAITAAYVAGTVWADVELLPKPSFLKGLENDLKIIFGASARKAVEVPPRSTLTIFDSDRLRNLQILIRGVPFKDKPVEEIVEMFVGEDPIIFRSPELLARLAMPSKIGDQIAFAPSAKELRNFLEYAKIHDGDMSGLSREEKLFYELNRRIPDLENRLKFANRIAAFHDTAARAKHELKIVWSAIEAVKSSEGFKRALLIIFHVVNTLTPKFGNQKGFKVSSFLSRIDRIEGAVMNPQQGREVPKQVAGQSSSSVGSDLEGLSPAEKKQAKLAAIRKRKDNEAEKDHFNIKLKEYLSAQLQKDSQCGNWWDDLIDVCTAASKVDQSEIHSHVQRGVELVEKIATSPLYIQASNPSSSVWVTLDTFVRSMTDIKALSRQLLDAKSATGQLWKWFGEAEDPKAEQIFEYVAKFGKDFKKLRSESDVKENIRKRDILLGALPLEKMPEAESPSDKTENEKKSHAPRISPASTTSSSSEPPSSQPSSSMVESRAQLLAALQKPEISPSPSAPSQPDSTPSVEPMNGFLKSKEITEPLLETITDTSTKPPRNEMKSKSPIASVGTVDSNEDSSGNNDTNLEARDKSETAKKEKKAKRTRSPQNDSERSRKKAPKESSIQEAGPKEVVDDQDLESIKAKKLKTKVKRSKKERVAKSKPSSSAEP